MHLLFPTRTGKPRPGAASIGWRDAVLFAALFAASYGLLYAAHQMRAPFNPARPTPISLAPGALPGYALRSLVRMYLAFGASILFTLVYGYAAAHSARAERILVPLLDILQSVPVLGFLSVTVTAFMALFPGSMMGLECASIFAIFTSQAWNMTFSFYQSLKIVPEDLSEAATVYRMNWWERFTRLEVPFAMIPLVWNGMMSFGGGWFFLAASEAITVLGHSYTLPGIGSYMAEAVAKSDVRAVAWAIVTMVLLVVVVDQLFWRPIVAWSQKYKFEQTASDEEPQSWLLTLLRRATFADWVWDRIAAPAVRTVDRLLASGAQRGGGRPVAVEVSQALSALARAASASLAAYGAYRAAAVLQVGGSWALATHTAFLGLLTLGRVAAMVIIASVIWTPVGVWIGFNPRIARIAQPLVQIGASFPANLLFPVVVIGFVHYHIDLNWGSILLLALGTQWYILFNVIAGASAVPGDLREAAVVFRLRGWALWKKLILPAVFPSWVTGALTATGGAWNASIVAEVASWGQHRLTATGLGAFIADATGRGDWPAIILGIAVMSAYVVIVNRLVWRRLYAYSADRFALG